MCLLCSNGWGNSMVTDILFDPLVPLEWIAGLGVMFALFLVLALWRGLSGWPLRTLAALVVFAALLNPSVRQEDREPLKDIVLIVTDQTASQSISDRPAQIAEALSHLKSALPAEDFEIREVTVADAPEGSDQGSLVAGALAKAVSDTTRSRIAGALVITDGQVHDMVLAPDVPAPVHILLTGQQSDWDRRLLVTNAPAFAIIGEPVTLKLKVEDQGAVLEDLGAFARLTVSVDGGPEQVFTVQTGREMDVPLTLEHGGQNVIQFEIDAAEGELTTRNNKAVVAMNGVRDRLRVLLVSGEPHAGERTWRNLLKSDASVDLVHFTILRPPGKQDGVPVTELSLIAFPTRELFLDKIDEFDLIIFDRYRRRGLLPSAYLENVSRYVEQGGAVLVAAGPAFGGVESLARTPLESVLPAMPTARMLEAGFVPLISELGHRHPVTEGLEEFAPRKTSAEGVPGWGRWFRMLELNQRAGQAVMTGPEDLPLLILDRVGKGRIALLGSDQAWLWTRGYEGGGPQLELLRRLAHWMMREPDLEEEALRATARGHNITITRRSMSEGARRVEIEGPDGSTEGLDLPELSPGRYVARYQAPSDGLYRISDGETETVIALGPAAPKEFESAISTAEIMAPLAASTNGSVWRLADGLPQIRTVRAGRVADGRDWIGVTPRGAYITKDIRLVSLATPLILLLLSGLLMVLAWRREGR